MNEISCKITNTFVHYVKNTRPELIKPLLEGLPYSEGYLSNPDNWISWDVERILEERLARLFNDEAIMFKIGRSIITLKSLGILNIVFNLFMTPERLIRYTPKIARYFTKDIVHINVIDTSKESATIELRIKGRQTRGACLFNQGMFSLAPELFGLEAADIREVQCVVPRDELGTLHDKLNETVFGAESCVYQLVWRNKVGFIRKFSGKKQALNEALRYLEENYAKLQEAYELIRRSEERYRDLMENASDIICFLDTGGAITSLNKKGLELSGYTLEELTGKNFISFVDDSYKEEFLLRFQECLSGKVPVFELVMKKIDHGHLVLSINPNPIKSDGNIIGFMFIARDITQEREMTGRLLEAERFAAKGMIVAEIAHEINNSLANIETALFIMNKIQIDSHYRKEILKEVDNEIEEMSGIVKGILEVYRSDDSVIQSIDINSEIQKVINITRRRLKGEGISILSRLSPKLPSIPCYPGHIKQILLNLIKNAEESMHSSNKRLITINTEEDCAYIKLGVSDTGCGIPQERMKNVFSPLFTSKSQGAGLGLSVCQGIVKKYGGDITIESEEGKGTTVTVLFPQKRYG